jgi:hypothetical protein
MLDIVFAQQTLEQSIAAWSQILGSVGTTGFTGWLCWHLITKAIPEQNAKNDLAQTTARKEYREESDKQRQHDIQRRKEEQDACDKRHREILEREETRHKELLARIESNHMVTKANHEMGRETLHGIKDIMHERGMVKATAELSKGKARHSRAPDQSTEDTHR